MLGHTTFEYGFRNSNMYRDSLFESYSYGGGSLQPKQPNNPFSNTYNQGWMNYLDSSWSNNQNSQEFFNQFNQLPPLEFQS